MNKPMIVVGSITYAMKGRDILFVRGISAHIQRLPRTPDMPGCGYALYVPKRTDEAEQILRNNGVRVRTRMEKVDNRDLP